MTYEEFLNEQENKQLPFPEIQKKFKDMVKSIDEVYYSFFYQTEPWAWVKIYEQYENGESTICEYESALEERISELNEFSETYPVFELPQSGKNIVSDEELEKYISNRKIEFEKSLYYTELWFCRSCYVNLRNEKKNNHKQNPKEILRDIVFIQYPDFHEDYKKLKTANVFRETDTGLDWNYSKQSLAEYFGNQKKEKEVIQWQHIEKLFTIKNRKIKGLKDSFNQYRNTYQKESKDYESIQKIIHN